jgi:hypothetical protein
MLNMEYEIDEIPSEHVPWLKLIFLAVIVWLGARWLA